MYFSSSSVLLSVSGVFLAALSLFSSSASVAAAVAVLYGSFFLCSFLFIFVCSCQGFTRGLEGARLEYHGALSHSTWTCASWSPRCCSCCCCDWCCCCRRQTPKRHVAVHDAASVAACLQKVGMVQGEQEVLEVVEEEEEEKLNK